MARITRTRGASPHRHQHERGRLRRRIEPVDTEGSEPRFARLLASVGGVLVIGTGVIHLYLYQDTFSAIPTIGNLFLVNFASGISIGSLVIFWPRRPWAVLGAVYCATTLAVFLISVRWGLFGYQETLRGAWQERAAAVEIAGALACLAAARIGRSKAGHRREEARAR